MHAFHTQPVHVIQSSYEDSSDIIVTYMCRCNTDSCVTGQFTAFSEILKSEQSINCFRPGQVYFLQLGPGLALVVHCSSKGKYLVNTTIILLTYIVGSQSSVSVFS